MAPVVIAVSAGAAMGTPQIQTHTLANGLEVYVVENHAAPLVTIEFAIKGGAMVETPALSGVSHFHEHMFMRSNQKLPTPEAYQARWRELGLEGNGSASLERVSFRVTTTADQREQAMVFMRDTLLFPRFDQKDLESEREVVIGELDRKESDPVHLLADGVDQRLWWKHPNRKAALGTRASIRATTPVKLRTVQQRYYVPNNALLVVSGDVQARAVFQEADVLYGAWKRGPDPFRRYPTVAHPPLLRTEVVVVPHPVQNVRGRMAWHGPSSAGPTVGDSYPAQLLPKLLQSPWSKFRNNLVYSGPCMGVSFDWQAQRNTGPIYLTFSTTADQARTCIKAIQTELEQIKSPDYFTDEELQLGIRRFHLDVAMERERAGDMADDLTYWWAVGGLDYYRQRVARVSAVTLSDIGRYLDTYVLGRPFVLGVMLSGETIANGLDQAYFEAAIGGPTASAR
jgi:zinc protease